MRGWKLESRLHFSTFHLIDIINELVFFLRNGLKRLAGISLRIQAAAGLFELAIIRRKGA
jgi:hypothetical protein